MDFEDIECWSLQKNSDHYIVKLIGNLTNKALPDFESATAKITSGPDFLHTVVDMSDLGHLPIIWLKALVQLQKNIRAANKEIRLVGANHVIRNFIKDQGVSLHSSQTIREALAALGLVTKKVIDVQFINPFLTATMNVLEVQAKTKSTPGKMSIKQDNSKYHGDISGVIGLISDAFNGSVVISFPESTFLKIMSRMLGEEFKVLTKDLTDGAAEITNMIFGGAKVTLNERGYGIKTAIPSVVTGKDHTVQSLTTGPQVVIPFTTDVGDFYIEICTSN